MSEDTNASLWLMLGEIRGDLKYLVSERRATIARMDELESEHATKLTGHDERLTRLEHFKTRIGVITAALGVAVPTGITIALKTIGLI